ncbi:HlyD family type I secretion periplasmic adaptor subunit [Variovorax davisae]|uniref:HlyD family type I secretion periplasmic adaptor subunit n=1 Tax=Variovorax davisae TaxID=3053515 RepID=UPI00257787ED|nr:HlyD family type I secretion periplasmic adaptor subunit [Variovorax sp. J22P271]
MTSPRESAESADVAAERRLRRVGFAVVAAIFGCLGLWAALAPLSSAAIGTGVISVEMYRKTVQHLEGGIVREIKVRDGQLVSAGEVLVTLEDTQPKAEVEGLRGQLFALLAREARLVAQRDSHSQVAFPKDLADARRDPRADDAMQVQLQTFLVRKQSHEGEVTLYQRQIQQLRAKASGLAAQKKSRDSLVASYESERVDFEALVKQGYAERQRVREMERNVAQTQGEQGSLVADLAATEFQVSEIQVKILQLGKELQREVAKELAEVQSELSTIREKVRALDDMVSRTVVRAPEAGMVLGMTVHTLGAVIRPGERILDIVPQNAKLVVEAQLSPQDIDQVRIDQLAEVRFPAFKQRDLPRIDGRLISVSGDRLFDDTEGRKVPYYLARVEIAPESLQALAQSRFELVPGMPAEILIYTGERTFLNYLIAPLTDTVARSFRQD